MTKNKRGGREPKSGRPDNKPSLLLRLEDAMDLPAALARVAQYIVENPEKVVHQTQAELSGQSESGQATIFRLCQELGFEGFTDLKLALAAELAIRRSSAAVQSNGSADLDGLTDLLCQSIAKTRELIDEVSLDRIADRLLRAERVILYGSGPSGIAAEIMLDRFLRLGLRAQSLRDPDLARTVAAQLGPESAAIAISQSGVSPDTVEFLRAGQKARAFTVAVTGHPKAPLSQAADAIVQLGRLPEPAYGSRVVGLPRSIFVTEALATAVSRVQSKRGRQRASS